MTDSERSSSTQDSDATEAPKRVEVKEKVIQYVGLSDIRRIDKADWALIGIQFGDVVWDKRNNWSVPVKDLPEEVLNYCRHDRELVVKE